MHNYKTARLGFIYEIKETYPLQAPMLMICVKSKSGMYVTVYLDRVLTDVQVKTSLAVVLYVRI